MKRRLPRNTVTPIEAGRRAEKGTARFLNMREHPASGAGRIKADMSDGEFVIENKYVTSGQWHAVRLDTLVATLREAERLGKEAIYRIEFGDYGIVVEGRIYRA